MFRPAEGYETIDSEATLVLMHLPQEVRLSPWRMACLRRGEIEALLASFGTRLGACLTLAEYCVDDNLLNFTEVVP